MYRHCIYCSASLGANEAMESFPVGRTLAFDAAKGRLWAVCGKCARWNLSPVEERWEPVEEAERLFREARLRAQSENIGLARLRDGTRLIRVGAALQGELAAWRYGDQLVKRRRRHLLLGGAATAAGVVALGGIVYATAGIGAIWGARRVGGLAWNWYRGSRALHSLAPDETPHGIALRLQRKHLAGAVLGSGSDGGIELRLPAARALQPGWQAQREHDGALVLPDRPARRILERGMVHLNASGASREHLDYALGRIASAGSAEEYIRGTAAHRLVLDGKVRKEEPRMSRGTALALEIALHEEQERRAMEGELSILEAAWRDAEEIAGIADRLAVEGG